MNIVPQSHWDEGYTNMVIEKAPDMDEITMLLKRFLPFAKPGQQAFEIGCFPGRFLSILGDLGYILNGVDTTPFLSRLKIGLTNMGYKTGKFENEKYSCVEKKKYDVVASFGFIEHFTNWYSVIIDHIDFLEKDGYLIITTPNFKGWLQYIYHRLLDNRNLKRHIVSSMSPLKWKQILENAGLEVISYGYIGHTFWDESNRYSLPFRIIRKVTKAVFKAVNLFKPDHSSIASYCYIIAKLK